MDKSLIKVNDIRLYAYHGCLEEEALIGGNYVVDVEITADLHEAFSSDDLSKTVDYSEVYQIVKSEMAIRSNLIEHVAKRIADKLVKLHYVEKAEVSVTKINPPMNGEVNSVSAVITS